MKHFLLHRFRFQHNTNVGIEILPLSGTFFSFSQKVWCAVLMLLKTVEDVDGRVCHFFMLSSCRNRVECRVAVKHQMVSHSHSSGNLLKNSFEIFTLVRPHFSLPLVDILPQNWVESAKNFQFISVVDCQNHARVSDWVWSSGEVH